jgi:ABC-type phosphate/phosphonate transport system permease subunit
MFLLFQILIIWLIILFCNLFLIGCSFNVFYLFIDWFSMILDIFEPFFRDSWCSFCILYITYHHFHHNVRVPGDKWQNQTATKKLDEMVLSCYNKCSSLWKYCMRCVWDMAVW